MATKKTPTPPATVPFFNQPVYVSFGVPGHRFPGFIVRARPAGGSECAGAACNIESLVALAFAQNLVLRPWLDETKLPGGERTLHPEEILKLRDAWLKAYRASPPESHVFACVAGGRGGVEVRSMPMDYSQYWDAQLIPATGRTSPRTSG
jgi:hypothetical protein